MTKRSWKGALAAADDHAPKYIAAHKILEGEVPKSIRGTLYFNGPGRVCTDNGATYGHYFDGDGYVAAFSFDGRGGVTVGASYVRTPRFDAQKSHKGKGLAARGVWSQKCGGWAGNFLRLPSIAANTSVIYFAGRLLALCEGGLPIELNPSSLETLGEHRPEGFTNNILKTIRSYAGAGPFFSAHPSIDSQHGNMLNFGLSLFPTTVLHVFELDELDGHVVRQTEIPVDDIPMVHDCVVTDNYITFILSPWVVPPAGLLRTVLGVSPLGNEFTWRSDIGSRVLVLRRSDFTVQIDSVIEPLSFHHFVNGWEDKTENEMCMHLLLHTGHREDIEANLADLCNASWTPETRPSLWEVRLSLLSGQVTYKGPVLPNVATSGELPSVHPSAAGHPHRYAYLNVAHPESVDYLNAIQMLDVKAGSQITRSFGEHGWAGVPVLIPKSGDCDSDDNEAVWVVSCVYNDDTHCTDLVIMDAEQSLTTVCRIKLPFHLPHFFHGSWCDNQCLLRPIAEL